MNSDLPVVSDCVGGTLTGSSTSPFNSLNHNGQGQSVGFADGHSEWTRTTNDVGAVSNISTGPQSGTPPYQVQINPQKATTGVYIFK